jgi:hypothetical protein
MSSGLIKPAGIVLCAVLATTSFSFANDLPTDGGWTGRSALTADVVAQAASFGDDAPVLTTATLPPRRPKSLAQASTPRVKPVYVQQSPAPIRIAQTAPVKQSPLFWMTVGTGF